MEEQTESSEYNLPENTLQGQIHQVSIEDAHQPVTNFSRGTYSNHSSTRALSKDSHKVSKEQAEGSEFEASAGNECLTDSLGNQTPQFIQRIGTVWAMALQASPHSPTIVPHP